IRMLAVLLPDWDGAGALAISPRAIFCAECLVEDAVRIFGVKALPDEVSPMPVPGRQGGVELQWRGPKLMAVEVGPEGGLDCLVRQEEGNEVIYHQIWLATAKQIFDQLDLLLLDEAMMRAQGRSS
ncbi:MAG: hypothetical protein M3Q75_02780, partial [Gemmatimonadota bacterium]|nr:hypothetical protein [Gemmatimonadota bacterium]